MPKGKLKGYMSPSNKRISRGSPYFLYCDPLEFRETVLSYGSDKKNGVDSGQFS